MKHKSYSERKKLRTPQLIKESGDYVSTVKELESDFENVKKVIKGSSITAFEVWLELGIKAGVIKEKDAQAILDKQNESINEADESTTDSLQTLINYVVESEYESFAESMSEEGHDESVDEFSEMSFADQKKWCEDNNMTNYVYYHALVVAVANNIDSVTDSINEAEGDGGSAEIPQEAEDALSKEIEAALKTVLNELPKELKAIADGGELELNPAFDKEASQELNEALGALIAGGALALPAITQILGKTVKWAGGKIGSGDLKGWGESIEHIGHDLHHKYEKILDKILSPLTKNMSPDKRALTNKLIFYSIITVLGGAGIAGAAKAAGAGQAGLAAVEGGLSSVKVSELIAAAKEVIPRVLGNMVEAA